MYSYWARNGPPPYLALQAIGRAVGVDWKLETEEPEILSTRSMTDPAQPVPTIAEVAAAAPKPGADLTETSVAILRQMGLG